MKVWNTGRKLLKFWHNRVDRSPERWVELSYVSTILFRIYQLYSNRLTGFIAGSPLTVFIVDLSVCVTFIEVYGAILFSDPGHPTHHLSPSPDRMSINRHASTLHSHPPPTPRNWTTRPQGRSQPLSPFIPIWWIPEICWSLEIKINFRTADYIWINVNSSVCIFDPPLTPARSRR